MALFIIQFDGRALEGLYGVGEKNYEFACSARNADLAKNKVADAICSMFGLDAIVTDYRCYFIKKALEPYNEFKVNYRAVGVKQLEANPYWDNIKTSCYYEQLEHKGFWDSLEAVKPYKQGTNDDVDFFIGKNGFMPEAVKTACNESMAEIY